MRFASVAVTVFVGACLAVPGARADDMVVVSNSAAIGFARGTVIEDGSNVTIPAGARLALIDVSGRGLIVRGPYKGPLHAPLSETPKTASVLATVKSILTAGSLSSGVARKAGDDPHPPDPRLIDVSGDATVCVDLGGMVELWSHPPARRTKLFVTRLATGERAELEWPANESTVPWPGTIQIADRERYQFAFLGALSRPRLLIKLEPPGALAVASAKRLADAGCLGQAVTMLEANAAADVR